MSRLITLSVLLVGCGAAAPERAAMTVTAEPIRGGGAWDQKGWEQRHGEMTWRILPNMARMFHRFEGTEVPRLSCLTCHGRNAEEVEYRMPNGLPPLDPDDLPRADSPDEREAKVARFMMEDVTPFLARMLDAREVSCFTCHPRVR